MTEKLNLDYFVIFGGGAMRGLAYIGVLKAFHKLQIEINSIAGSSVGSLLAGLYSVGYNADELVDPLMSTNFELFKDINFNLLPDFSLSKGEVFLNWVREKIEVKFPEKKDKMITFSDIDKDLYIFATDLSNTKSVVFSRYTTPDFEVAKAIRISCSLPGLMKPLEIDGNILVDGDLTKSAPLFNFVLPYKKENQRFLEFRLEGNKKSHELKNAIQYADSVVSCLSNFATANLLEIYPDNESYEFVIINTKDCLMMNLNAKKEKRFMLLDIGYDTTLDYFKNILPKKTQIRLNLHKALLKDFIKIENKINANCCHDVKIILGELFIKLFNIKENLDEILVGQIREFEYNFSNNFKETFLFFKPQLKNRKLILSDINLIKSRIIKKIDDLEIMKKI